MSQVDSVRLRQRRVLITAGAAGIGREMARTFAAAGDSVCVCDIDAAGLDALRQEITKLSTIICDISKRQEIENMVKSAVSSLGGLDILVNNAGIAGPTAPVEEFDPAEWDKVIQVDLTGMFDVTRLSIPHLKRSSAGVIINMSSVAGRLGYANRSAYSAAKWGVIGFTKTLSIELGDRGIRVNAILPGAVEGPRIRKVFEARARLLGQTAVDLEKATVANQSIKGLVDPRDIAALAFFLASDSAKSISGQILPVDNDMQRTT